jgi:hypothetical protein
MVGLIPRRAYPKITWGKRIDARAGEKLGDHDIVERQRERQQEGRQDRQNSACAMLGRACHQEKHLVRPRTQVHRCLFDGRSISISRDCTTTMP